MSHPLIGGGALDVGRPDRPSPPTTRRASRVILPEPQRNRFVLPILLTVSLAVHVALMALAVFVPKPAEAAQLDASEVEINVVVEQPIDEELEALPEPEPEPVPQPEPVVRPRRTAPEPTPEPAPPAPVLVAEGSGDWAHDAGEEGGELGGTPGGTGTGETTAPPVQAEAAAPRHGLSRRELRRRVLAYIRGTLSTFVNGRLDYPLEARRNHLEGVVVLRLRLDEGGELVSVRLSRTSGHQLLDRAALACVQDLHAMPPPPGSIPWDPGLEIPLPITYRLQ